MPQVIIVSSRCYNEEKSHMGRQFNISIKQKTIWLSI